MANDLNTLIATQVARELAKKIDMKQLADEVVEHIDVKPIAKALQQDLIQAIKHGDSDFYIDLHTDRINKILTDRVIAALTKEDAA